MSRRALTFLVVMASFAALAVLPAGPGRAEEPGPAAPDVPGNPVVGTDGTQWYPTPDDDAFLSGDPETIAALASRVDVEAGGGYALYASDVVYPSTFNVWLSDGPYADAVQPHLLAALVSANPYVGNRLVWRGRTAPRSAGPGEIVVQPTGAGSPCGSGSGTLGCGGINYSGGVMTSGRVWIHEAVWGYPEWVRRAAIFHEFGHSLGLAHFDGLWDGRYQTMRSIVSDTVMVDYGTGDLGGMLDMANLGGPIQPPPPPPPPAALPSCPSVGHFARGAAAKLSVFRPGNGTWYVQQVQPGGVSYGGPGDSPCAADYDGDGVDDLAVFRPSDGKWYVRGIDDAGVPFGGPGDIPVAANYDGVDGQNLAVFRPDTGTWYAFGRDPITFGGPGDQPVPGDYNGDGRDDVAVFRPSSGRWYVNGGAPNGVAFGGPGDVPVMSDFNGDSKMDFAVYRNVTGQWFVDTNRDGVAEYSVSFGSPGDAPVPADFSGDGRADAAVFRPSNGRWYVRSVDETGSVFGGPGDLPGMRTTR